jgi:hypothetical protein
MRRFATTYFMLVVYGAVVWGTEDQIRHRPGWAQWGMLLLWGVIAWPFADGLFGRSRDDE